MTPGDDKLTVFPVVLKPGTNRPPGDVLYTDTPELAPTGHSPVYYDNRWRRKGMATWRSREWETVPYLFKVTTNRTRFTRNTWNFRWHDPVDPPFYYEQAQIIAELVWTQDNTAGPNYEYILLPPPNTIRLATRLTKGFWGAADHPTIVDHYTDTSKMGALFQLLSPAFSMDLPLHIKPFCTRPGAGWALWFCTQCMQIVQSSAPVKCSMRISNCDLQITTRWEALYGAE